MPQTQNAHGNNRQPIYLPTYWPDLKLIERTWLSIKARWFNNYVCKKMKKLLERLDQAILEVIDSPKLNQQTTAIGTLF
jgi:transposase